MMPVALSRIAQWTHGRLQGEDVSVDAVATDTRAFPADAGAPLFVAIRGERFDGHDHLAAAKAAGARAALVSRAVDVDLPQVVVADTVGALAAWAGALQRGRATKVVAVTGSNGKTSVKQLVLSILSRAGHACGNPGNRNNEIGLPLAVIDAPDDADFAVYEMGAGKPGDIAYLTAIARPDAALVNNIAPAHLERMRTLDAIADTKAAIYDALPDTGVAVINADDTFANVFAQRAHGHRILRFALDATADVTAQDVVADAAGMRFRLVTPAGEAGVALPLPGRHNVANALAAAALALACNVDLATIVAGLEGVAPVAGRLVQVRLPNGALLIDDSYNANPGSLNAAIDTLAAMPGERWLVLGDMRELGDDEVALHAAAGRRARAAGLSRLLAFGPLSAHAAEAFGAGGAAHDTHAAITAALREGLQAGTTVLVKGSRGSAMDRVVAALKAHEDASDAA